MFVSFLAIEGLAPQTCKSYLAAIRNMQISLGLPDPREQSSLPVLKRVQAGISRTRMLRGATSRIRLPTLLSQLHDSLMSSSNPEKLVVWTIASTAFFGFFRLGELLLSSPMTYDAATCLSWGDIAIDSRDNPSMVQVWLRKSKCDQFGKGAHIILGNTGTRLCPVLAILKYTAARKNQPQGPFFLLSSGVPATKAWFTNQIRATLQGLGFPQDDYAGHSFRIGAATTAAMVGIADSSIQTLGRWQSAAFLQYIRTPASQLASFARTMSTAPASGP